MSHPLRRPLFILLRWTRVLKLPSKILLLLLGRVPFHRLVSFMRHKEIQLTSFPCPLLTCWGLIRFISGTVLPYKPRVTLFFITTHWRTLFFYLPRHQFLDVLEEWVRARIWYYLWPVTYILLISMGYLRWPLLRLRWHYEPALLLRFVFSTLWISAWLLYPLV